MKRNLMQQNWTQLCWLASCMIVLGGLPGCGSDDSTTAQAPSQSQTEHHPGSTSLPPPSHEGKGGYSEGGKGNQKGGDGGTLYDFYGGAPAISQMAEDTSNALFTEDSPNEKRVKYCLESQLTVAFGGAVNDPGAQPCEGLDELENTDQFMSSLADVLRSDGVDDEDIASILNAGLH